MTFSAVLEVGLGLTLVYYVLGLIVSWITSDIAKWTELRAEDLEEGLRDLLADSGRLEELMEHPWIKNLRPRRLRLLRGGTKTYRVERIPASTFTLALFDVLVPSKKGLDRADPLKEIRSTVESLPEGKTRNALLGLINTGVTDLETARGLVEGWFDDAMNNVSMVYRQHARRIVISVALVTTLVTGVDSIAVVSNLWSESALRSAVSDRASEFAEEEHAGDVQAVLSELEEMQIPILWDADALPENTAGWVLKVFGLFLTWLAVSQGSSFWYDVLKRAKVAPGPPRAMDNSKIWPQARRV